MGYNSENFLPLLNLCAAVDLLSSSPRSHTSLMEACSTQLETPDRLKRTLILLPDFIARSIACR